MDIQKENLQRKINKNVDLFQAIFLYIKNGVFALCILIINSSYKIILLWDGGLSAILILIIYYLCLFSSQQSKFTKDCILRVLFFTSYCINLEWRHIKSCQICQKNSYKYNNKNNNKITAIQLFFCIIFISSFYTYAKLAFFLFIVNNLE